ncbi:MAG: DUF5522 domain-containing protein [Phycisphaerae bacterium]
MARSPQQPFVPGRDYSTDSAGRIVMSAAYLLSRRTCCGSGCRNCPYPPDVQQAAGRETTTDRPPGGPRCRAAVPGRGASSPAVT